MKKNTGYREMLRDRCPKTVSFALKLCKTKEAWLDHVYKNWIRLYCDKKERLKATKIILGYTNKGRQFVFKDTIAWDNLTDEETKFWKNVESWVSWFQKEYPYIENGYSISKKIGKSIEQIKVEIMSTYLKNMCPTTEDDAKTREKKNQQINNFVDFLIDCFEDRI